MILIARAQWNDYTLKNAKKTAPPERDCSAKLGAALLALLRRLPLGGLLLRFFLCSHITFL